MARRTRGTKRAQVWSFSLPGEYAPYIKRVKKAARKQGRSFGDVAIEGLRNVKQQLADGTLIKVPA